ncbi:alpha/beta hydrolase [Mycolicibacterium sp.]|uniref:alpha/beta hydrolase family protein n=1 Tax=Mycolicibacterium sp. TaxID=2320850 RepID=UPI001A1914B6|nr:alpha/beta hydrolase [Mycolicibacterium sp.]MBJ7340500.1 alpha/beta hydrolase [Mycolicibacterium sp.]
MEGDAIATARMVMQLVEAGRFTDVHELFAPAVREMVSADAVRDSWQVLIATQGPITVVGAPVRESAGPSSTIVKFPVTSASGGFAVLVEIDQGGGLHGLQFAPPEAAEPVQPWQLPSYADPATFTEHDVTIDCAPLATPGTLSLPDSPQPAPAVVLLAGSGPADQDATLGRNKILRDLAWGLASRGIAVLRFDKVTYTYRGKLDVTTFTVVDEYVRPAIAAVRLLREHPLVDPARVFVLGHSQGGTMAPRIGAAEPSVAGLIVLAGATQPLHHTLVRQYRYLATLRGPGADPDADPAIQTVTRQCALVDSPDLSPSTPQHLLPLGVPAPYWLDLRSYDPVAVAAELDTPMLIMQGGRDYQVTVADDLIGWQTGLADHRDVTIRIYPADNHLFFTGSGPSTPDEYGPAQHVDDAVVIDIAQWVTSADHDPRDRPSTARHRGIQRNG